MDKVFYRKISKDDDIARIELIGVPDKPGVAHSIFFLLDQNNLCVNTVYQSTNKCDSINLSMIVSGTDSERIFHALQTSLYGVAFEDIIFDKDISRVFVVSIGLKNPSNASALMIEALIEQNIYTHMVSSGEEKIFALVKRNDADRAVSAVRSKFIYNHLH